MDKSEFLSDLVDVSHLKPGRFNIIDAPCGSGKSTLAINKIARLASVPKKVLYLADTKNLREQLAKNEHLTTPYIWYPESIDGHFFGLDDATENEDRIVVTTYAQLGSWQKQYPSFISKFEIIICDECHSLVSFSNIKNKNRTNYTKAAFTAILAALHDEDCKTIFVGLTATPQPLQYLECYYEVPYDKTNVRHYENKNTVCYASINQIMENLPAGKGGLFTVHIKDMLRFREMAIQCGRKPICIWSQENQDHEMNTDQRKALDYIIENEALPDEYDLLIFNSATATGINIRGEDLDFFIAHTQDETYRVQSRGRFRTDIDTFFVYDKNNGVFQIPSDYLDRPLNKAEFDEMLKVINLKTDNGRPITRKNFFERISELGYTYEKKRISNKRCVLIHKLPSANFEGSLI